MASLAVAVLARRLWRSLEPPVIRSHSGNFDYRYDQPYHDLGWPLLWGGGPIDAPRWIPSGGCRRVDCGGAVLRDYEQEYPDPCVRAGYMRMHGVPLGDHVGWLTG